MKPYTDLTYNLVQNLFDTCGYENILDIIQNGLLQGKSNSQIRDDLNSKLNQTIPPRLLPLLFDYWYPDIIDMNIKNRRIWAHTQWPVIELENRAWSKLYDANHPIYKHFTRTNMVNWHGQKSMAKKRNVAFEFDFISWIVWWMQTGHFHERGVGNNQYQMCRKNDVGPYNWDNVYCDTGANNKKAYAHLGTPVIVNGVTYPSANNAAKVFGMDRNTFLSRLAKGKYKFQLKDINTK